MAKSPGRWSRSRASSKIFEQHVRIARDERGQRFAECRGQARGNGEPHAPLHATGGRLECCARAGQRLDRCARVLKEFCPSIGERLRARGAFEQTNTEALFEPL